MSAGKVSYTRPAQAACLKRIFVHIGYADGNGKRVNGDLLERSISSEELSQ